MKFFKCTFSLDYKIKCFFRTKSKITKAIFFRTASGYN